MSTHGRTPYWEGEDFGRELVAVAQGDITPRMLYSLAKRFANLFGWRDLDTGGDWMQGFMSGIEHQRAEKLIEAPKSEPEPKKPKPVNSVADALRQKADEIEAEMEEEE